MAELCGHAGTRFTEAVYRHQLRPVLLNGAVAMDRIFDTDARLRGIDTQLDTHMKSGAAIHQWIAAPELVDHTWQNPNHIPAAHGTIVTVVPVRRRAVAGT
jgi:hypothetical protein